MFPLVKGGVNTSPAKSACGALAMPLFILKHFDSKYGFEEWQNLTTPDVFRIVIKENESQVDRIWQ